MKDSFFYLFVVSSLLFASCNDLNNNPVTQDSSQRRSSYSVSLSEINRIDFSRMVSPVTKSDSPLTKEITPVVESADTLLYIINYGDSEGWVLAPADKRAPQIIAMSKTGHFDLNEVSSNKSLSAWLENAKKNIVSLKKNPDMVLDSTALRSWGVPPQAVTKGGNDHEYEWLQLVYTVTEIDLYEKIPHLMETSWGQESPWNTAAPLTLNNGRCPIGCGATAVAQVLYYHHYNSGKPQTSPSSASCSDYYNASPAPSLILGNASPYTWNGMSRYANENGSTGNQLVAALMADVAWGINTLFAPSGSPSSLGNCRDYLQSKSFNCSVDYFNDAAIVINVGLGRPVIVGLDSTTNSGDHIAVIDGVCVYKYHYTYYYQWMPIGTYPPVEPEYPDMDHLELYEISDGWGAVHHYGYLVNWGFDGSYDNGIYNNIGFWYANGDIYEMAPILYNIY